MNFMKQVKRIVNTGQSRSIVLTGNIYDLFWTGGTYRSLIDHIVHETTVCPSETTKGITHLVWRLNNPIEIYDINTVGQRGMVELDWVWNNVTMSDKRFSDRLKESQDNTTFGLELLRQITECMRMRSQSTKSNLIILIESADLLLPEVELSRTSPVDRRRISIVHDWFSDLDFLEGGDTVILLSESRSAIHHRIARLPQVISVDVPQPNLEERATCINQYRGTITDETRLAEQTAGLSNHAIRQLMLSGEYSSEAMAKKVEEYMIGQLGDGVVEFKRPKHKLSDVIGFSVVKEFLKNELIPGFLSGDISGAAVGGPIGGGKTFLCEAVAAELGIPVVTLKNIRSKWYGETDQIFERLKRLLESFHRIVIFVDEADTQFGGVGSDEQAVERRLTGKIQAMMSDTALKGRVIWFLMTARIHLLSPDIRRPGRMDIIIPVLDPQGEDFFNFIDWTFEGIQFDNDQLPQHDYELLEACDNWSAASFAMLKSRLKSKGCKTREEAHQITKNLILPDIETTRRYQSLQALLNCTHRSLLPKFEGRLDDQRRKWKKEVVLLEQQGVT